MFIVSLLFVLPVGSPRLAPTLPTAGRDARVASVTHRSDPEPGVRARRRTASREGGLGRSALRIPRMTALLIVEDPAPHVRRLVLNRPEQLNTMTAELCEALHVELRRVAAERSVRAVIVTGAGRGFCAGLDLHGYGAAPGQRRQRRTAQPAGQPAAHVEPDPRAAGAAAARDRGRERPGGRLRARARARLRHPLRRRGGRLPGGVPEHRRVELRHGNELAAAAPDRSLPIARADAHREALRRRGGPAHRPGRRRGRRRDRSRTARSRGPRRSRRPPPGECG